MRKSHPSRRRFASRRLQRREEREEIAPLVDCEIQTEGVSHHGAWTVSTAAVRGARAFGIEKVTKAGERRVVQERAPRAHASQRWDAVHSRSARLRQSDTRVGAHLVHGHGPTGVTVEPMTI